MNWKSITIIAILICICGCANSSKRAAHISRAPKYESLAKRVHFPFASHRVYRRDRAVLANNARWLLENPEAVIVLEGHCDERGSDEFNMELGDRRARSVMAELVKDGVKQDRLIILSQGEENPLDTRKTKEAWKKNRRVEFSIR